MLSQYREGDNVAAANTETTPDIVQSEEKAEETIPLTDERLDVSKNVQERHATIIKRPVTETKTVKVPVTHEDVSIERRPLSGGAGQVASERPVTPSDEISIPLKEEEVEANKTHFTWNKVS